MLLLAGLALSLSACAGSKVPTAEPEVQPPSLPSAPSAGETGGAPDDSLAAVNEAEAAAREALNAPVKIGLLLPLSGSRATVGQSILNAAQLALFDLAGDRFTLVVRDTAGTREGAVAAAESALAAEVSLILGPLFSTSVEAVKPLLAETDLPLITFSNNTDIADPQTFVMGVTPRTQVDRIVDYAVVQGVRRFAVLAPESPYGSSVVRSFQEAIFRNGVELSRVVFFDPGSPDISAEVRALSDYDQRAAALKAQRRSLNARNDAAARRALARLRGLETLGPPNFDGILIPASGRQLLAVAPLLAYYDVDPDEVRFLGTALWDDPSLRKEPSLKGSWFPAPPPALWRTFSNRYRQAYGRTPPRVASLGYDAVALAAVLDRRARNEGAFLIYTAESITQPVGFSGIDGIFRFLPDGQVQRGLAILELQPDVFGEVDPAPQAFGQEIN
ncbi:penicillin-binding protein activator [Pelagibius litoralis]|uniref:Penicillin-binding protein activator n=1 Tax=Pelagibius litoralis TaxID=374515 RepID=A0A967KI74_9PROT|nr:penicillin-binding protein activator [Pelagibius litoralis]NIA72001.1 penicillin-binding protein activator [Pelagibius litoralis]